MRSVALVVLVACSRESAPPTPKPAAPPLEGGSYRELVSATQSSQATETRTDLVCSKQFVELSKAPRREVKSVDKYCQLDDLKARFACYDKREKVLEGLSAAELWKQAEPNELVQAVVRRLFVAAEAGATLTATERELVAAYMFDGEVRNGGFHQFFFNSSGDDSLDARAGLARFGMTESVALLDCAMTAFPGGKPSKDREARNDQLARWGERQFAIFDTVTDAYYVVDDDEWQRVYPYVRDHRAELPNAGK
jgi:hypothetical protein